MIDIQKTNIFTDDCYSFTLPNHEEWSKNIKTIVTIEENKDIHHHITTPEHECNVKANRTAWDSHFRYPIVNSLNEEIVNIIYQFIEEENFDAPKIKVEDCWINWYKKNDHAEPHDHGKHLSIVYFVDVEETDAQFMFFKRNKYSLVKKEKNKMIFNDRKLLTVKNGTVVMFSGDMLHSVTPNTTDATRITYAANFIVEYDGKHRKSY